MVLAFPPCFQARAATNLTIDGSHQFQTIDGFGVNANSLSWKNGELKPAIDMLADQMGSNLWRVVFDMEDWEADNDNSDPNVFNWDYYNSIYANAKFQNLWGTIGYLNQKGISSGIILSLMGRVPDWMGGSKINTSAEDEWVEMVASLVYYARNTMHLSFSLLDPLNEPDWNGYEGPQVDQYQYSRLLDKLSQKLDSIGLSDTRFVGPNTASVDTGVTYYMAEMMRDSVVMAKVDHYGFHNYEGYADSAEQAIKNSAYPDRNFYMTEITTPDDILAVLNQGPAGIHIWDGYDSVYNHAILMGYGSTPPNDAGNGPAPLAYDLTTGTYSPRKTFYLYEQLFKYVPSGSVKIEATQSNGNAAFTAYYHQSSGRVTIVGTNSGTGSISFAGTLANLPGMGALQFYWTSDTDPSKNFFREDDLAVTNGAFAFTAPPNSTFTLTGHVNGADLTPPLVSITAPAEGATVGNTVTISASASDSVGVAGVRFLLNGVNLGGEIFAPPYNLAWDTKTVANGNYQLSAVARDVGGNTATSSQINIIVANQDTIPPTVSITSPHQNDPVSGTVTVTATANDNVAVAGVQFLLDNVPFRSEITTAPYSVSMDTTTINDGIHLVAAMVRDTSGNTATSQSVLFNVINNPGAVFPVKFVQKASNITSSAQNLAATLPSPVTAGNLIVVSVSGWPNLPASPAVTDSLGNTYSIAGDVLVSQGAYSAIYYAKNVNGGTNTVTFRTVSSGGQISIVVAEFSGADTVSPLDTTAGTVGSGTTPSSGTMSPGLAGELIIGSGTHNGSTVTTAGGGFTIIAVPTEDSNTHQPLAMEYQVLGGNLPTTATFNLAASYPWTQNGALFRPAVQQGPDTNPPTVSITSPQNGATVSAAIAVFAAASDNVGVTRVEYYLDGVLQATITSTPYAWSWNTLHVPNGSHTLIARAYDAAGNVGQSGDVAIMVFNDTLAPTVSVSAPDNNATVSGTVAVTAVAVDNVGVSKIEFYVNGMLQATDTNSPYSFNWNTATVANGPCILMAQAYDTAGNSGTSNTITVTVANPMAGIGLVQRASNITSSAQNLAATLPLPVTAGNLIVVSVSGWPNLPASPAVTDSLGNTYSIAGDVLVSQGAYSAIYYARNVSGGTNTVTFRTVSSGGQISIVVAEFSGADTVSPLDTTTGTVGSGTTPSSGTMSPSLAGDLVIGSGTHNGSTVTTAGAGFTMIAVPTEDSNTYQPLAMEYQVLGGNLPTTATFNLAASYPWTQNGVLFRPAVQQGPDTTPPTVSITSPQNGATVSAAIAVFAAASDNVGVTRVEFYLDNVLQANDVTSPYSWTWNSSLVPNGAHTLRAAAYDAAGNNASSSVTVLVNNVIDMIAPTVTITAPVNGATVSGTAPVTAVAADNVGVTRVEFYLDGVLQLSDSTTPYEWSWNSLQAANGSHTLSAMVYDAAGNTGQSGSITATVFNDTAAPTVVVTAPASNATVSGTVTVTAGASDNVGVSRVEFYLNGALQVTDTTAPYSFSWNTAAVGNGIYTLTAKAYDAAGNIGTSPGVIVTVANPVAGILLVQKATNITSSAQNISATLPSPVTAGNLIVVSVSGWPNLPAATPVTDSRGNTYSIAGTVLTSQKAYSAIYYARNVTVGTDTVTVRTVRSGGQISVAVAEFSGIETVSPLDRSAGATGSGYTPSSGTMTPSQEGDLVIGSGTHNGDTVTTAGPGFTMIAVPTEDSKTHQPLAMEYQVLSGSQPISATFSLGTGFRWTQNGALFKHK